MIFARGLIFYSAFLFSLLLKCFRRSITVFRHIKLIVLLFYTYFQCTKNNKKDELKKSIKNYARNTQNPFLLIMIQQPIVIQPKDEHHNFVHLQYDPPLQNHF